MEILKVVLNSFHNFLQSMAWKNNIYIPLVFFFGIFTLERNSCSTYG